MTTQTGGPHLKAGRREWLGLAILALACLVYAMDLTVLHLAVPAISADLRPNSTQLLWIVDIYGFMVAGFLIIMGTLGDRIGRRRLLLIGGAAFGLVSLLAAFSPTPEMLIASRALLGIAGATLAPSTLSLIFNMFRDVQQRSVAIGVWIGAFSAGGALGPLLGGVLLESFWWGSVFLLAIPVMALLLVVGPAVLPEFRAPHAGRLDLVSAALSLAAVLAMIFGIKQVAQDGVGWLAATSILGGLAIGTLFVRRQLSLVDPMIELRLLRIPAFSASLLVNLLGFFVLFGYFLFVAQYLQLVLGLSPLRAGLWSVPSAVAFIVGSQATPRVARHLRPGLVIGAGLALAAVGLTMLAQVEASSGLSAVVVATVLIGIGLAPVFALITELIVGSAPPERSGGASGIAETSAELGGALGISILGSIGVAVYRTDMAHKLPPEIPPDARAAAHDTLGAAINLSAQLPDQLGVTLLEVSREAFVRGMQLTSMIAAAVAIAIAVLALVMLRRVPAANQRNAPEAIGDQQVEPDTVPRVLVSPGVPEAEDVRP